MPKMSSFEFPETPFLANHELFIYKQKHSKCFKASRNFTFNDNMVSDGVGDFWINQTLKNDSISVMENGILEDRSSENEVLHSTMDLNETDMPLNLTEVL